MKALQNHGFGDKRLDGFQEPVYGPGHAIAEPLCVQPGLTEAQLAFGIPTPRATIPAFADGVGHSFRRMVDWSGEPWDP